MVKEIKSRLDFDTWNNPEHPWKIEKNKVSIIDANEIAKIIGNNSWISTSFDNYFYFDTGTKNRLTSFTSTNRSAYFWLYNNMYQCKPNDDYPNITDYGCTHEDNTSYAEVKWSETIWTATGSGYMYGYWTSTPVGDPFSYVWYVNFNGRLFYDNAKYAYRGIRPVIKLSSSLIQ